MDTTARLRMLADQLASISHELAAIGAVVCRHPVKLKAVKAGDRRWTLQDPGGFAHGVIDGFGSEEAGYRVHLDSDGHVGYFATVDDAVVAAERTFNLGVHTH